MVSNAGVHVPYVSYCGGPHSIGYSRGSIDGETFSFVVLFPLWSWVVSGIILVIFRDRIKKTQEKSKKRRGKYH
jgi:hypothetical protein